MTIKIFPLAGLISIILWKSFSSFTYVQNSETNRDKGQELYLRYCAICHLRPDPKSLSKEIWRNNVLPAMATRMGIVYPGIDPLGGLSKEEQEVINKNHIIPSQPLLSFDEWQQLVDYIVENAPESIPVDEERLTRNLPLKNFVAHDIKLEDEKPSLITSLKYNNETKTLWFGDYYNSVYTWQYPKGIINEVKTNSPTVDFSFDHDKTYFTEIGSLYPTELSTGSFVKYENGNSSTLLSSLHRPVNSVVEDLDDDGEPEFIVCNYGNRIGSLSLFTKDDSDGYSEKVLFGMPGAINCQVKDIDGDGKKDIIAMFAQGDESVYIFYQKDNLKFKNKRILRFPPHYGTTDMVLTDYNQDGFTDIITVHGDNADYSNILKPYHGIRIHLNNGKGSFNESFFYPIYGVTKVLAEDFDKDGDIDLVATAFFPDFNELVDESFLYLENIDSEEFKFKSYNLNRNIPIKSLALIKADVDGDGDMDVVAGHFADTPSRSVPKSVDDKFHSANYGLTVFINQLHKRGESSGFPGY
ncbi:FG-GAP repeat domain-containing protein [Chondrinema litorale]|uniref:FG-GAP repeat domain-containing protein n=1 Tax=Chondrinema litorale TaxID=2994555 RepID=UPI00254349F8|nr:VCBS repeat-containing protein [Chondrinema litorale]UZR98148.1 VCBS repeat-containing protein [Chondrinema litorale]